MSHILEDAFKLSCSTTMTPTGWGETPKPSGHSWRTSRFEPLDLGRWLAEDVPVAPVLEFLNTYRFHEESRDLRARPLAGYIEAQLDHSELETWNIGVIGQARPLLDRINLGLPERVNLINRSDTTQGGYANIKTLMSRPDSVMDLDVDRAIEQATWSKQLPYRPSGKGLLLIYPISKDSIPQRSGGIRQRYPLNAVAHVIGVAICFPVATRSETAQSYVAAPLEADYSEEFSADIGEQE